MSGGGDSCLRILGKQAEARQWGNAQEGSRCTLTSRAVRERQIENMPQGMHAVEADDVQQWGLQMERARVVGANVTGSRSSAWLPEIDQILLVGLKHGRIGIREAVNKVVALRAGLTRGDCWKRLRLLRDSKNGDHPAPRNWPQEVKDRLREGYQEGGQKKRQALKAIRKLYPGLPSHTPSRFARRQGWLTSKASDHKTRPWTDHEERKLWELAGYETAARIGERLGRSEEAVRCRLKMLGLSVRVKDGWSFRALQQLLHVGPSKLRRFIVQGSLRVRDPRLAANSLAALWETRMASTVTSRLDGAAEAVHKKLRKGPNAYSWGSTVKLLGVNMEQVRAWIVKGELKIVDGFVTERAFQDFCRNCGAELNGVLLGNDIRDWLAGGYSLRISADGGGGSVPSSAKHALVTRQCPKCQKRMRGNIFFKHVKNCKGAAAEGKVAIRTSPLRTNLQL
jgi:hypothetical protein